LLALDFVPEKNAGPENGAGKKKILGLDFIW